MQPATPPQPESPNENPAKNQFSWTLCPGCVQRQESQDSAPCNVCGRTNPIQEPRRKPNDWDKFRDWMLQPLGWFMQITTICAALPFFYNAVVGTTPGSLPLLALFIWLPLLPLWLCRFLFRATYLFQDIQRHHRRTGWRSYALLPFCIMFIFLAETTYFIPKIGLWFARPSLEAIMQNKSLTGKQSGLRAGPYSIIKVERYSDEVQFQISQGDWGTSITSAGFSYQTKPPIISPDGFSDGPNYTKIAPNWYWYRDSERYYPPIDFSMK